MIIYILAIVLLALLAIISLAFIIGGLIKKNQKVWVNSLISFVLVTLLMVYSVYVYIDKTIDYIGSEEFQQNTMKKAENIGKTWGNTVSGTAKGLSQTLDEDAIAKLANKSAIIIGKGIKAIEKGVDESVGKTIVFADKSISEGGINIGRAEAVKDSSGKFKLGLFLEFKKDFSGNLSLNAFDQNSAKKGISLTPVTGKTGTGKVYLFSFDYYKPALNDYCILSMQ